MNRRKLPPALIFAIVCLTILILARLWLSLRLGTILMLDASMWAIILFGLIVGHRWAFVLTIAIPVLEMLLAAIRVGRVAPAVLVINALVIVPVILSRDHFFPAGPRAGDET